MQLDQILIYKLIPDIGLLVLIWLVQLVIYPSFKYYKTPDLKHWHNRYTRRITLVVLPLMLGQLVLSIAILLVSNWRVFHILDFVLVTMTWISTFVIFVPLHQKIDQKENPSTAIDKLIKYNWLRTFLWSLIAVLSFFKALI